MTDKLLSDLDYFKYLEEIEQEEEDVGNVLYHFGTMLEIQRETEVDWEEVDFIYENYKKWKYLKKQVNFLKMIRQPEQRTQEWYDMRNNMITASDISCVVGDDPYGNIKKVFNKKAFFIKDEFTGNFATEWGVKYEPIACKIYQLRNNVNVNSFGLIPHYSNFQHQEQYLQPISFLGASPDGICDDGTMLEIKCPTSREITGIPPRYYWIQMQIQMECCNLEKCHFLECKFSEFSSETEFFSLKDDIEKGIVSYNSSTKQYNYLFPLPESNHSIIEWRNKYKGTKLSYFILQQYSCVVVERDREWFSSVLPKIRAFWKDVLEARKNPEKYIETKKEVKPKKISKKKETCKITFDQFEQLEDESKIKTIDLTDEQLDELQKSTCNILESSEDTTDNTKEQLKKNCLLDSDSD